MRTSILLRALAVCCVLIPGQSQAANSVPKGSIGDLPAQCKELESADFSRIRDAITQVVKTKIAGPASSASVDYCDVDGYVAPSTEFALRLPSTWNGKLIEIGCGGACGTTSHIVACDDPLRRGYACIVSNGGHTSSITDVKWAYHNPQAVIDYFILASHVTAVAGKAIVEHYYGAAPRKSYFMGCSAGGIQAMWQAQRFPWDFDGIIAGAPCPQLSESWMNLLWGNRALRDQTGKTVMVEADLETLHQAVVAKCDLNDGIADGLIGDPRACHFDPSAVLCTDSRREHCLTAQQIEAVKKIYDGPRTSTGKQVIPPSAQRGSERSWLLWFASDDNKPSAIPNYTEEWFRYFFFQPNPGPTWRLDSFDFDVDFTRMGMAEIVNWGNAPDLRRFKSAGGKLLSYTGWNDAVDGVLRTVDYYESVERVTGGRAATQDFFRLFVVPGMNHCGIGGDGASTVDWLSYLEAWVEEGKTPDRIVGMHVTATGAVAPPRFPIDAKEIEFSRPIYPYPTTAGYIGRGDPRDAANFVPVNPKR